MKWAGFPPGGRCDSLPSVNSAVIVAAGRGTRMGPGVDKLFLEIAGRPAVAWTWLRFDQCPQVDEIVLVVRADMESEFARLRESLPLAKPCRVVTGGKERQDSVWNGLQSVSQRSELIAIQDGARPGTPPELIGEVLEAARATGAAVAAQRVTDTIKQAGAGGCIERTLDRSRLWSVQTPQAFRTEVFRRAMEAVRRSGALVTDDTAACELIGQPVRLVECRQPNPKITSPADVPLVELLLRTPG